MARTPSPDSGFAARLCAATNAHDVERLVDCFAEDYTNETPAHPARGFRGREQVRRNWTQIFGAVPDIRTQVLRRAEDGDTAWTEWEMRGTRPDGSPHLMRGVIVFTVHDGLIAAARFYLEPVELDGVDADAAIRQALGGAGR